MNFSWIDVVTVILATAAGHGLALALRWWWHHFTRSGWHCRNPEGCATWWQYFGPCITCQRWRWVRRGLRPPPSRPLVRSAPGGRELARLLYVTWQSARRISE